MFCPNCGAQNPEDAKFCLSCGAELPPSLPNEAQSPPPPNPWAQQPAWQNPSPSQPSPPPWQDLPPQQPPLAAHQFTPLPLQSQAATNKGKIAMVLGIASIFPGICISCIGIGLGVAAVVIAKQELANISKGISPAGNASNANIGFYTGIAGIALNILFTLLYLVFNLLGAIAR